MAEQLLEQAREVFEGQIVRTAPVEGSNRALLTDRAVLSGLRRPEACRASFHRLPVHRRGTYHSLFTTLQSLCANSV
jgi:hypothetical protein